MPTIQADCTRDAHRLHELADAITLTLSGLSCVRTIALFGSLAEGRADAWSDIDMLVVCDDVETMKWLAADALRRSRAITYYRPFSTATQPSGRYWLANESPFHKLDISFNSPDEHAALQRGEGSLGAFGVTISSRYQRKKLGKPTPGIATECVLEIDSREDAIGNAVYQSLRSLKRTFRGEEETRGFAQLLEAASELRLDAIMAGGRIGELVHAVAGIIRSSEPSSPDFQEAITISTR